MVAQRLAADSAGAKSPCAWRFVRVARTAAHASSNCGTGARVGWMARSRLAVACAQPRAGPAWQLQPGARPTYGCLGSESLRSRIGGSSDRCLEDAAGIKPRCAAPPGVRSARHGTVNLRYPLPPTCGSLAIPTHPFAPSTVLAGRFGFDPTLGGSSVVVRARRTFRMRATRKWPQSSRACTWRFASGAAGFGAFRFAATVWKRSGGRIQRAPFPSKHLRRAYSNGSAKCFGNTVSRSSVDG